jgi:hypothetical protein
MTLSLGVHSSIQIGGASTGTTAGVTTQAIGSGFRIDVVWFGAVGTPTISDNKGNSGNYVQIGSTVTDSGAFGGDFKSASFHCLNGAGGAGHTWTVTFSGNTDFSLFATEAKTTNGAGLVVDSAPAGNYSTSSPYTSNNATTTVANTIAFVIGGDVAFPGTATVDWSGSSFTAVESQGDTTGTTGHTAYRLFSSTGTFAASFTATGAPTSAAILRLTAYSEASAGGGGPSLVTRKLLLGVGA